MKKYITLFSLAVTVVGLAITIDRGDYFCFCDFQPHSNTHFKGG